MNKTIRNPFTTEIAKYIQIKTIFLLSVDFHKWFLSKKDKRSSPSLLNVYLFYFIDTYSSLLLNQTYL